MFQIVIEIGGDCRSSTHIHYNLILVSLCMYFFDPLFVRKQHSILIKTKINIFFTKLRSKEGAHAQCLIPANFSEYINQHPQLTNLCTYTWCISRRRKNQEQHSWTTTFHLFLYRKLIWTSTNSWINRFNQNVMLLFPSDPPFFWKFSKTKTAEPP